MVEADREKITLEIKTDLVCPRCKRISTFRYGDKFILHLDCGHSFEISIQEILNHAKEIVE